MIPVRIGVSVKVSPPVPPLATKADEESARPFVVVIDAEPPEMVTGLLIVIVIGARVVAPTESVSVIVS